MDRKSNQFELAPEELLFLGHTLSFRSNFNRPHAHRSGGLR